MSANDVQLQFEVVTERPNRSKYRALREAVMKTLDDGGAVKVETNGCRYWVALVFNGRIRADLKAQGVLLHERSVNGSTFLWASKRA